jgi:hypothetical protein
MPEDARPRVLVCASGTDYYPFAEDFDDDEEVVETAKPGDSFLARVCRDWEKEASAAKQYGVRVVGRCEGVRERFFAISAERRLAHPAVVALTESAREIFS